MQRSTSDFKRGPVRRLMTRLVREAEAEGHQGRVHILNVMGLRPDESPARRRLLAFAHDSAYPFCSYCAPRRAIADDHKARDLPVPKHAKIGWGASNTPRHVDTWLPVHTWSTSDVWAAVRPSGLCIHPAYAAGMPRLSCVFCVLASRSALVRAAQLQPTLAARYAALEERIGHRIKADLSMADIIAEAEVSSTVAAGEVCDLRTGLGRHPGDQLDLSEPDQRAFHGIDRDADQDHPRAVDTGHPNVLVAHPEPSVCCDLRVTVPRPAQSRVCLVGVHPEPQRSQPHQRIERPPLPILQLSAPPAHPALTVLSPDDLVWSLWAACDRCAPRPPSALASAR
ncbi:hypothetical protein [Streptomyces cyaneofuscatus]|uniref:hypothetical protein n=1 Tax=Streptomyces cyaneofuscatus TaxID=66883 RepID=UPI00382C7C1E